MPASGKLDGSSGDSPAGGLSNVERQEEILRSLSELTRLRPNDRSLSPDFRLQLQLLECSLQQQRLLQQVAEQQRRSAVQLEAMHCQGTQCQELMQQRLSEVAEGLEQVGQRLQKQEAATSQRGGGGLREAAGGDPAALVDPFAVGALAQGQVEQSSTVQRYVSGKSSEAPATRQGSSKPSLSRSKSNLNDLLDKATSALDDELIREEFTETQKVSASVSQQEEYWLARMVKHQNFDLVCGFVIACNAATMGLQTNQTIQWRLDNVGNLGEVPVSEFVRISGYFYMTFYILELLSKLIVFRWAFFFSDQWKWNLFDSLLVLVGVYDIVVDAVKADNATGTTDVGFMRLLRLLRMTKLLRVVRVMRIFRVLRMMLNSIAGSMMTLMWSILMLSLMMYVFSLCFIQIIAGYLGDTPVKDIQTETLDAIRMYWGNVYQSIITLYYAVTGGADWEPLAQPVREAGEFYYLLFLFYIAFTAFAVLNVLTGLYVDTATKISERDDESVGEELIQRPETSALRDYFQKLWHPTPDAKHTSGPMIAIAEFNVHAEEEPVKAFLKMAELTAHDCRRIFRMLDFENIGKINLEEFIGGCLHSKSASQALDMIALLSEVKRTYIQQRVFMSFTEERFDVICDALDLYPGPQAVEVPPSPAPKPAKTKKK